ncbi:hypothetical protein GCM10027280_58270 [Micromonospora polyrhachis]|uniref:Uncharacterized protein n=1 Tax=Micromonospora polyrhachis TaxID=1282883 RepID=A0A7W7SP29_9ACTN|nr:hypothetical protein [Micromonospora polyrhachis]MBB4957971.1 hypothetical protein [Micromonospora polyrhachis]
MPNFTEQADFSQGVLTGDEPDDGGGQGSLSAGYVPGNGEVIMLVRRVGARLAVVAGLSAGLLGLGTAPALAADDRVKVSVSSSIVAGSSAGAANVSMSRREDGCVDVRIGLSIKLSGLEADQVRVAIAVDGDWQLVGVSGGGDGLVAVTPTAPAKPRLCKGKSASLRFRLAFLPGAPAGRATVVAEAYDEDGSVLGRDSDTTKVVSTATSSPTRTPSASPTSTPPPVESPDAGSPDAEAPTTQPALASASKEDDGGSFGVGAVVMILGVAMVGIGVALLVVLLRRRGREASATDPTAPSGVYASGVYRSGSQPAGGSHPAGPNYPPPPGPNYPPPPGQGYPPPPGQGYPPPAGGGDSTVIMPRMPR